MTKRVNEAGEVDESDDTHHRTSSSSHRSHRSNNSNNNNNNNNGRNHRASRGRRRKHGSRRNEADDADAQRKQELREQRRAQNNTTGMRGSSQEMMAEGSAMMIGDELNAANVQTVPATTATTTTTLARNESSGSRSRAGQNRPTKPKHGPPAQIGAVAAVGRAYGAAPRRGDTTNNMTRSMVQNGPLLTQEEIDELTPKEAMAMNVQTVEDYEADEKRERRRKQKLEEEKKRLKKDMASNNPAPNAVLVAIAQPDKGDSDDNDSDDSSDDDDDDDDGTESENRFKTLFIIVGVVVLLIAVSCTAYFVTRVKQEISAAAALPSNQPSVGSTPNPTATPSTSPSTTPSTDPTDRNYDPPSEEDCLAILNGSQVTGQEGMIPWPCKVTVNVQVTGDSNATEVAATLEKMIQEILILELAGCPPISGNRRRRLQSRQGNGNGRLRHLVGNAIVKAVRSTLNRCSEGQQQNQTCYEMEAIMDTFLRGNENGDMIVQTITNIVKDSVQKLVASEPAFEDIVVQSITRNYDELTALPTGSPSLMPSFSNSSLSFGPTDSPSGSPSLVPTATLATRKPSASPSMLPSTSPTKVVTKNPTRSPTNNPTKSPTNNPTRTPTASPTTEQDSNSNNNDNICVEDLVANTILNDDPLELLVDPFNPRMRVPCTGTNPIVAYALADYDDCSGRCIAILELAQLDRLFRGCDDFGHILVALPGEYLGTYITMFQSKTSIVTDACPPNDDNDNNNDNGALLALQQYNPGRQCQDYESFQDSDLNTCERYAGLYPILQCPEFDDDFFTDSNGFTAFDACCWCGGGYYLN
ncbi:unnamed protein product [Cylindrotheca closterium]|uniref:Uncharacterized protein n=1 Tax=Cylindrotheca closterium TaxID=2856 RepID=A0AAD2FBX6_9STRA|nr:unnamed protein product [Cylindrotheca closterium]